MSEGNFDNQAHKRRGLTTAEKGLLIGAGIAALAGGTALTVEAIQATQKDVNIPNEVEKGPVLVHESAILRTQPVDPEDLNQDRVDTADNTVDRTKVELNGQPLDRDISVRNLMVLELPNGERWGILKGVKEGDRQTNLFFQLSEKGVKHPLDNAFGEIQPDGSARTSSGEHIAPNQFQEVSFPPNK